MNNNKQVKSEVEKGNDLISYILSLNLVTLFIFYISMSVLFSLKLSYFYVCCSETNILSENFTILNLFNIYIYVCVRLMNHTIFLCLFLATLLKKLGKICMNRVWIDCIKVFCLS